MATASLVVLALIWFFLDNIGVYGFNFWLPMMIKRVTGFSSAEVAVIAATPFIGALIAAALVSLSSDRTGERRFHTALPMATFAIGLILSVVWSGTPLLALRYAVSRCFRLSRSHRDFGRIATNAGRTSGSTAIAIITSAGAIGGFCGPYVMGRLKAGTGTFSIGLIVLASMVMMAAVILLVATKKQKHPQNEESTRVLTHS